MIRSRRTTGSATGSAPGGVGVADGTIASPPVAPVCGNGAAERVGAEPVVDAVAITAGRAGCMTSGEDGLATGCGTAWAVTSSGPITGVAAGTATSISVSGVVSRGAAPSTGALPSGSPLARIRPSK